MRERTDEETRRQKGRRELGGRGRGERWRKTISTAFNRNLFLG